MADENRLMDLVQLPVPASGNPDPNFVPAQPRGNLRYFTNPSRGTYPPGVAGDITHGIGNVTSGIGNAVVFAPWAVMDATGQVLGLADYASGNMLSTLAGLVNSAIPGQPFGDVNAARAASDSAVTDARRNSWPARAATEVASAPYIGAGGIAAGRGLATGEAAMRGRGYADKVEAMLNKDLIARRETAINQYRYRNSVDSERALMDLYEASQRPPPTNLIGYDRNASPLRDAIRRYGQENEASFARSRAADQQAVERATFMDSIQPRIDRDAELALQGRRQDMAREGAEIAARRALSQGRPIEAAIAGGEARGYANMLRAQRAPTDFNEIGTQELVDHLARIGYNLSPMNNQTLMGANIINRPMTAEELAFRRRWVQQAEERGFAMSPEELNALGVGADFDN